jgi:hypothetical protein
VGHEIKVTDDLPRELADRMRDRRHEAWMKRAGSCQSSYGVTCFQHQHALAASCQISGTNKPIVACADDNRVVVLHLKFTLIKLDLLCQIEIIDGVIRVDTVFIRRIVRERFDFGTPKYLAESDNEADTIKHVGSKYTHSGLACLDLNDIDNFLLILL